MHIHVFFSTDIAIVCVVIVGIFKVNILCDSPIDVFWFAASSAINPQLTEDINFTKWKSDENVVSFIWHGHITLYI